MSTPLIPSTPPSRIIRGDSSSFHVTSTDYPPTDGWTLTFSLRGAAVLDQVATVDGSDYLVSLTTTATEALVSGLYGWACYVAKSGQRVTVERGSLQVLDDLATQSPGYDPRTTAKIALDQCQAAMRTFQSSGGLIKSYTIGDRTMTFQDFGALMQLESRLKVQVANEATRDSIASGMGNPRKLHIRFRG